MGGGFIDTENGTWGVGTQTLGTGIPTEAELPKSGGILPSFPSVLSNVGSIVGQAWANTGGGLGTYSNTGSVAPIQIMNGSAQGSEQNIERVKNAIKANYDTIGNITLTAMVAQFTQNIKDYVKSVIPEDLREPLSDIFNNLGSINGGRDIQSVPAFSDKNFNSPAQTYIADNAFAVNAIILGGALIFYFGVKGKK